MLSDNRALINKWSPDREGVSVIVPTFNRAAILEKVLFSLDDQSLPANEYEVIVVDDGSEDDTAAAVSRLQQRMNYRLGYIRNEESRGVTGATNRGIKAAEGEILVIINDDALADRRLLEEHLLAHSRTRRTVFCGQVFNVPAPKRLRLHPVISYLHLSFAFFCGTNVSVRRRELLSVGLFDENIRYGYEDLELGFRLSRAGFRSHLNRRCQVFHYKKPQTAEEYLVGMSRYARELGRGAAYYYWKHRCLRVMMSTGIFPFAVCIHKRFFSGGQIAAFMRRALASTRCPVKLRILPGLILYRLEFYDAVCQRLDELGE